MIINRIIRNSLLEMIQKEESCITDNFCVLLDDDTPISTFTRRLQMYKLDYEQIGLRYFKIKFRNCYDSSNIYEGLTKEEIELILKSLKTSLIKNLKDPKRIFSIPMRIALCYHEKFKNIDKKEISNFIETIGFEVCFYSYDENNIMLIKIR